VALLISTCEFTHFFRLGTDEIGDLPQWWNLYILVDILSPFHAGQVIGPMTDTIHNFGNHDICHSEKCPGRYFCPSVVMTAVNLFGCFYLKHSDLSEMLTVAQTVNGSHALIFFKLLLSLVFSPANIFPKIIPSQESFRPEHLLLF
jgi:hypothetical protein